LTPDPCTEGKRKRKTEARREARSSGAPIADGPLPYSKVPWTGPSHRADVSSIKNCTVRPTVLYHVALRRILVCDIYQGVAAGASVPHERENTQRFMQKWGGDPSSSIATPYLKQAPYLDSWTRCVRHFSIMVVDAIPSHHYSLQDSLTQLAQSFQAHEATTSAHQIAECLERIPTSDRSALDRLLSLIYRNTVGAADGHVQHRHIHGADSDLTGTCKHQ
jgi:hypothetical protein